MAVIFETNLKRFEIPLENLQRETGQTKWPKVINLRLFSVYSVQILVKYLINPKDVVKVTATCFIDLYDMAEAFKFDRLKKLLDDILLEPKVTPAHICTSLSMAADRPLPDHTNSDLMQRATDNFKEVSSSPYFSRLPPIVVCDLLQRCDLPISNELEVATAALNWLRDRGDALEQFYMVFCAVRVARMSRSERNTLEDRVHTLTSSYVSNSYQFLPLLHILFNETDSARCCVLRSHVERGYGRCGEVPEEAREANVRTSFMFEEPRDIEFGGKNRTCAANGNECLAPTPGWLCTNLKISQADKEVRTTRKARRKSRAEELRKREEIIARKITSVASSIDRTLSGEKQS